MPEKVPYTIAIKGTITANGTLEFTFKAPNNQPVHIHEAHFNFAGIFNLIRMQTDDGRQYTNASTADPILSTELPSAGTDVRIVQIFYEPLMLDEGKTLTIELQDTSAASNLGYIYMMGDMIYP